MSEIKNLFGKKLMPLLTLERENKEIYTSLKKLKKKKNLHRFCVGHLTFIRFWYPR